MGVILGIEGAGFQHAVTYLTDKLVAYISRPEFESEYAKALEVFWTSHPEGTDITMLGLRFQDWLLFDYRIRNGRRVIEIFGDDMSITLNRFETLLLERWAQSYFGIFRIVGPFEDGVQAKEVLSGEIFNIVSGLGESAPGILVTGRPLWLGKDYRLSGTLLPDNGDGRERLVDEINSKFKRLEELSPGISPPQFYRLCGHFIDSLI